MDDEIAAAAARLVQSARTSGPVATRLIDNIADATNGGRVRADTLFKTEDSIRDKLRRFSYGKASYEYARTDESDLGRAEYFDDESGAWVENGQLYVEISADVSWLPCSEDLALAATTVNSPARAG